MSYTLWETDFREFENGYYTLSVPGGFSGSPSNAWTVVESLQIDGMYGDFTILPLPGAKELFCTNRYDVDINNYLSWTGNTSSLGYPNFLSENYEIIIYFHVVNYTSQAGFQFDSFQVLMGAYNPELSFSTIGQLLDSQGTYEWTDFWNPPASYAYTKELVLTVTRQGSSINMNLKSNGTPLWTHSKTNSHYDHTNPFRVFLAKSPRDGYGDSAELLIKKISVKYLNTTTKNDWIGTIGIKQAGLQTQLYKIHKPNNIRFKNLMINKGTIGCVDLALPYNTKRAGSEPVFIQTPNHGILRLRPEV